jgi:hypothetical protein
VVAVALAWSTVAATRDFARDTPERLDLTTPELAPLRDTLDDLTIDRVYADYWIAYPLTLATDARIVASPIESVRSTPLHEQVTAAPNSTYVVYRDGARDEALAAALRQRSLPYRRLTTGQFAVYLLTDRVPPGALAPVWRNPSP